MKQKDFMKIQFSGLKIGKHDFDFQLEQAFFELFKEFDIESGSGKALATLDKQETFLGLRIDLDVNLNTTCDRCGDDLDIHISHIDDLIIKFTDNEEKIDDETIICLPSEAYQLSLDNILYELIVTQLPLQKVHSSIEDCNQEVIERLNISDSSSTDDRWDALKELLNTN